jgi:phenylalanyl-tRNA synthetase beta chain
MNISRNWLQMHFEQTLPDAVALSDALTFHAFEIDGVEQHGTDDILDVKVTPNRGHDCLCHRGIAKELSAILEIPMKADPLKLQTTLEPKTNLVEVTIEEPALCKRFTAGYIKGVSVGPSPEWLKTALESVGQRSINNVVDATNFVMFNLGQPLHAFDAGKLVAIKDTYSFVVRKAQTGEKIMALDNKEYELAESMLVVADAHAGVPAGIAGVKGGLPAAVDANTNDIILEAANFDGVSVRKTAAALKLRTDASSRFEQVISPDLAAYGMNAVAALIREIAGGELVGFVDVYPTPQEIKAVSVTATKVNAVLGTQFPASEMEKALTRLDLSHVTAGDTFTVTPRFERLDLTIPEDLVEEIGRIIGYDKVPNVELAAIGEKPVSNENFDLIEYTRQHMTSEGYSEVYTSVFAEKGERQVLNKVGGERPYLRANLIDGLKDALERNARIKDALGLKKVKLFEIGSVWTKNGEALKVGVAEEKGDVKEYSFADIPKPDHLEQGESSALVMYKAFSKYPFVVRDIAMWSPNKFELKSKQWADEIENIHKIIFTASGPLMVPGFPKLVDEFQKDGRTSFAFRLVFQSHEKTLTDEEVNAIMATITAALTAKGFEIR